MPFYHEKAPLPPRTVLSKTEVSSCHFVHQAKQKPPVVTWSNKQAEASSCHLVHPAKQKPPVVTWSTKQHWMKGRGGGGIVEKVKLSAKASSCHLVDHAKQKRPAVTWSTKQHCIKRERGDCWESKVVCELISTIVHQILTNRFTWNVSWFLNFWILQIYDFSENNGTGAAWLLCSFYHDSLRH